MAEKKRRRVLEYLRQGKPVNGHRDWNDPAGEPGTTMVNVGRVGDRYWLRVEIFLAKHAYAEDLYITDTRNEFDSIEELEAYLERVTGFRLEDLHG